MCYFLVLMHPTILKVCDMECTGAQHQDSTSLVHMNSGDCSKAVKLKSVSDSKSKH